ncbi:MAG: outer membrane protein assembly factor BamE [Thiobacillus sp.]|nr:outer membrane protein assembly factor BamE [Thiobacillus sp.]
MRPFLISALLLSLVSGCSTVKLGPHRIDVQQGNALDQENVARLKTGLNRSQVRFLLGTPLVVDPFRTDRWDYVYVNYKAGKLAEQKRITLFFDGETLVRIEGDVPAAEAVAPVSATPPATTEPRAGGKVEPSATETVETRALAPQSAPLAEPIPSTQASSHPDVRAVPASGSTPAPTPQTVRAAKREPVSAPTATPEARKVADPAAGSESVARPQPAPSATPRDATASTPTAPQAAVASSRPAGVETSVVSPLSSPKNAPTYRDPRTPAELSLQAETNIEQLRPDVMPAFPEPGKGVSPSANAATNDEVLSAVRSWVTAWTTHNEEAYLAAYDADFVPQGRDTRAEWEKSRRLLLRVTRNIDLKIDSPSVAYLADGTATVTFNQSYRSDNFHDAVVKQLRMVKREEQWLILEEKVISVLRGSKR